MSTKTVCRLVDAVVVRVFVARDAAHRLELARGVGVLHVAAQLEDEHATVAVERDGAGLFDIGVSQHGRHAVTGLEKEVFLLFSGWEREDRGLLREVGVGVGGVRGARSSLATAPSASTASCFLNLLARLSGLPCGRLCGLLCLRLCGLLCLRLCCFDDNRESADVDQQPERERPEAAPCANSRPHCAILASKTRSAERARVLVFAA